MRNRRIAVTVSAAALSALVLAGCGDDSDDSANNNPSPSASQGASDKPSDKPSDSQDSGQDNGAKDAKALADEAVAAMDKVPALKVTGTGVDEEGKDAKGEGCARMADKSVHMNMTMGDATFDVISVGDQQYLQGDPQDWANLTGQKSPAAMAVFQNALAGGKWVRSTNSGGSAVAFFGGNTTGLTKGAPMTYKGKQAIPLSRTDKDGAKQTFYIAAKGTPLIYGKTEVGPGTPLNKESTFEKADKCDATAPAPAKTIDAEELDKQLNAAKKQ